MNLLISFISLLLISSSSCIELPIISSVLSDIVNLHGVSQILNGVVEVGEDLNVLHFEPPGAKLSPCQLIESRGFICDEHFIITKDGYILSIQHIVHPVLSVQTIKPVVIQHGLFGASVQWLVNSDRGMAADWTGNKVNGVDLNIEGRDLPYLLANLGYDVWIPNIRGNRYSRNHTHLNPDKDKDFWKFSYEQMITFDAPTIIDYILHQTGHHNLGWVGHSMGTTMMFGLLSERPAYSKKIEPFIALAPVARVGHITTPVRQIADLPTLKSTLTIEGGEFNLDRPTLDLVANQICGDILLKKLCDELCFLIVGDDTVQFNQTLLPLYVVDGFCGTSVWTVVHYLYNANKDRFAKFDYGTEVNLKVYRTPDPPKYDLSVINLTSIILFNANGDHLADPVDVLSLKKSLKVKFYEYTVPEQDFGHMDFIFAENVYSQVYGPLVSYLKMFS